MRRRFILSRATARSLLAAINSGASETHIKCPCDFGLGDVQLLLRKRGIAKATESANGEQSEWEAIYEDAVVPMNVVDSAFGKNVSYEVFLQNGTISCHPLQQVAPDGTVLSLTEPEYERHEKEEDGGGKDHSVEGSTRVLGSMLYLSDLKMHRSKGFNNTLEFSQMLARAAGVRPGHATLDLFLGLGYSAKEAILSGARSVLAFEKYPEVAELLRKNPFSPKITKWYSAQQRRVLPQVEKDGDRESSSEEGQIFYEILDLGTQAERFFSLLDKTASKFGSGGLFDSCILDPPKRKVMLRVYSKEFLRELSKYVRRDSLISTYVPEGGLSPRFQECRAQLVDTFVASGFAYLGWHEDNRHIYVFVKT